MTKPSVWTRTCAVHLLLEKRLQPIWRASSRPIHCRGTPSLLQPFSTALKLSPSSTTLVLSRTAGLWLRTQDIGQLHPFGQIRWPFRAQTVVVVEDIVSIHYSHIYIQRLYQYKRTAPESTRPRPLSGPALKTATWATIEGQRLLSILF